MLASLLVPLVVKIGIIWFFSRKYAHSKTTHHNSLQQWHNNNYESTQDEISHSEHMLNNNYSFHLVGVPSFIHFQMQYSNMWFRHFSTLELIHYRRHGSQVIATSCGLFPSLYRATNRVFFSNWWHFMVNCHIRWYLNDLMGMLFRFCWKTNGKNGAEFKSYMVDLLAEQTTCDEMHTIKQLYAACTRN